MVSDGWTSRDPSGADGYDYDVITRTAGMRSLGSLGRVVSYPYTALFSMVSDRRTSCDPRV
ncbi:hypothetical protein FAIPA1_190101 [Frankia sp. AiPs1]